MRLYTKVQILPFPMEYYTEYHCPECNTNLSRDQVEEKGFGRCWNCDDEYNENELREFTIKKGL